MRNADRTPAPSGEGRVSLVLGLALAAAIVLALALPGPGLVPLVLIFPGLLLEAIQRSRTVRVASLAGLVGGTVHWAVTVNWVLPVMRDYGGLPTILASLCLVGMSAILGLTWAVAAGATRAAPPQWRALVLASAWAALEGLRQLPPYLFPWNPVAACVADTSLLLGSLPVWGATGLGWALLAVGGGAWALLRRSTRTVGRMVLLGAAALPLVLSSPTPAPRDDRLLAGLIQPGTTLGNRWDPALAEELMSRVEKLTRAAAAGGAELVLWPESAAPYSLERDAGFRSWLERLARELDIAIVLNSIGWTTDGRPTNSAYVVSPDGVSPDRYAKVRLVPFGEYVPAWASFAFTRKLVRQVGQFAPGDTLEPIVAGDVPLGVAICYEIVFPGLVAEEVRNGAQMVVTLTNDGWYGYSWAPRQHFAEARLRAVEARRWVLRAALTGISGCIDPSGTSVATLSTGAVGFLLHPVTAYTETTLHTRWGDWWGLVSAGIVLVVLTASRLSRRREPPHAG